MTMRYKLFPYLFSVTLLLMFNYSHSQIVINEYSAANLTDYADEFSSYEDWVEIKNTGLEAVDISNWYLSDKLDNPTKWQIPEGTILEQLEVILIVCSGRDLIYEDEYHTNFKLSQTSGKDQLILSNSEGSEVHSTEIIITEADYSMAYISDEWKVSSQPTPNIHWNQITQFERYAIEPTIQLEAGFYNGEQSVLIENNEPNSVLRYSLTGHDVTSSDPIYATPILIDNTTILKARSFSNNSLVLASRMAYATYFIDETFTLPVFSLGSDEVIDLANGDGLLEPIASVEYFDEDGSLISKSYGEMNRHGKDSWGNPHRSLDFICRDEMGYSKAIDAKLFETSDRDEFQRLMFRASGDDNYPARIDSDVSDGSAHVRDEYVQTLAVEGGLELDSRKVRRVILFLNGQYWGVYGLREKVADHDYTKEYYDQDKFDLEFVSHWGSTVGTYGGTDAIFNWYQLRNFINTNDMSIEDNYSFVEEQLNMLSMIDYFLVNLNVVAADWLSWNTAFWRGTDPEGKHKKWGYVLWDMDATFDYYINYSGIPNTDWDAVPCDLEVFTTSNSQPDHENLLLKLLDENAEFRNLYITRYSDLTNTSFSCDNMLSTLDRMIGVIEPEMPRQIERWGGSMEEWQSNVVDLRLFIENRCGFLNDAAIDCYDELNETYNITLLTEPDGIGEIDFNTLDIESFPWEGDYFGGVSNKIKAKVFNENEDDWIFSHWESRLGNEILPDVNTRRANITLLESDTLVAVFAPITAVNEITQLSNLVAFPNPASESINLDFDLLETGDLTISISDLVGRQLYSEQLISAAQGYNQWSISLNDLGITDGMYIVNLKMKDQQISRKVSVIRKR